MSDSDSALSFIRQRRDLFVISALLIVAQVAHFRINETLSLLGASITVGKPEVLVYSLWLLWAYWLVRYVQFFRREKAVDKVKYAIFDRVRKPLAIRSAILFYRDHPINVFQPVERTLRQSWIDIEDGFEVEYPHLLPEGVQIYLRKNDMSYTYLVPLEEYIECVLFQLPHFIIFDTEFTDYLFPLLFAFAPLVILISQN
ncbi:MAG: hypothetical protein KKB48_03940 [Gammaproteobacteria bacterium]|nr:hypothetical protein [Sideroxydans sp.]MBU3903382.1 hypothetical protein [Gammaproteobacteria bacterium]